MRILILSFLFINLYLTSFSQVIKGEVFEKKTNKVICFATVYFNGTFVGTTSNKNGYFELDISKYKSMPLTISAIGYYSVTLTNFSETEWLTISLQPKIYELNDVTVSAKSLDKKRKRNLRLFKEEFIGITANARECKILNENDITFNYDSDDDTLKAYALNPILIENKALGYNITYYLDKFEYYKKDEATFFCGNIIFNEDLTDDESQKQLYKRERKFSYLGSRMHFFRVLWLDNLSSSGFIVRNTLFEELEPEDIVFHDINNNNFLRYSKNIVVEYNNRLSSIEFVKDSVYFDESGFFNPGILWKGKMSQQRVADWLPYEYFIEQ